MLLPPVPGCCCFHHCRRAAATTTATSTTATAAAAAATATAPPQQPLQSQNYRTAFQDFGIGRSSPKITEGHTVFRIPGVAPVPKSRDCIPGFQDEFQSHEHQSAFRDVQPPPPPPPPQQQQQQRIRLAHAVVPTATPRTMPCPPGEALAKAQARVAAARIALGQWQLELNSALAAVAALEEWMGAASAQGAASAPAVAASAAAPATSASSAAAVVASDAAAA